MAITLDQITDFPSLINYFRDELDWEIPEGLSYDDSVYHYTADELGLKIETQVEITQLRPILGAAEPWGVFFVNFNTATLPVTMMRRILNRVSKKKRESANAADRVLFNKNDLLFVSAFGEASDRRLALAHFHQDPASKDLPTLRVLAWDRQDNARRLADVDARLEDKLRWPDSREMTEAWRERWSEAFTERPRQAIHTAKEMATALAAVARRIRDDIKELLPQEKPGGQLTLLFDAVKQALSRDLDVPKFADTYAQTIAYGLLSARINQVQAWQAEKARTLSDLTLDDITAEAVGEAMPTTNPFLRELFGSFLTAGGRDGDSPGLDFDELGVGEVVALLNDPDTHMESVLLDFDKQKAGDDPVIHFYEGFLTAYDNALKVKRGVFYTPRPVVSFIVRSVDEVIRTQFGLKDGLADVASWDQYIAAHPGATIPAGVKGTEHFVKILDPATGTGTFLVEVIDLIHGRMTAKWTADGLNEKQKLTAWNDYVPKHLLPRIYGFELMMAPYAVAHMKIGLKLADTGYAFGGKDEEGRPARARVFLTNALEPAQDLDMQLTFMSEALAHEAHAANTAKANVSFTVVLGNPPYSLESGNLSSEHKDIIEPYRYVDGTKIVERAALQLEKVLNDDYVKFVRIFESSILRSGVGCVGIITSHAFLDSLFLRGLRRSLTQSFNRLRLIDLHGNSAKLEKTPSGGTDNNVFDIQQGVAITIADKCEGENRGVFHREIWGTRAEKYEFLQNHAAPSSLLSPIQPHPPKYLFIPAAGGHGDEYGSYAYIPDCFAQYGAGYITARDNLVIDLDRTELIERINRFANSTLNDKELLAEFDVSDKKGWSISKARTALRGLDIVSHVIVTTYRPFDIRYIFYHDSLVWGRSWPTMRNLVNVPGNVSLVTTKVTKDQWDVGCTSTVTAHKAVSAYDTGSVFPLFRERLATDGSIRTNLSANFTARLGKLTGLSFDDGSNAPAQISLGAAFDPSPPAQGALLLHRERGDFHTTFGPRDAFDWIYAVLHSPCYRARYADFLKSDFARVPLPKDRALFTALGPLGAKLVALQLLDTVAAPILADPAKVRFINPSGAKARLDSRKIGERHDAAGRVYVNDGCWFETVPNSVWNQHVGGYQPAQKWLKDRAAKGGKIPSLGRVLTAEDLLHYRRIIVALDETAKVVAEIDQVIDRHGGWPDAFRGIGD